MATAKKTATKTARGRNQDRALVASMEDYEVKYLAQKHSVTQKAVKAAVEKVGNSRTKVEREPKAGNRQRGHFGCYGPRSSIRLTVTPAGTASSRFLRECSSNRSLIRIAPLNQLHLACIWPAWSHKPSTVIFGPPLLN